MPPLSIIAALRPQKLILLDCAHALRRKACLCAAAHARCAENQRAAGALLPRGLHLRWQLCATCGLSALRTCFRLSSCHIFNHLRYSASGKSFATCVRALRCAPCISCAFHLSTYPRTGLTRLPGWREAACLRASWRWPHRMTRASLTASSTGKTYSPLAIHRALRTTAPLRRALTAASTHRASHRASRASSRLPAGCGLRRNLRRVPLALFSCRYEMRRHCYAGLATTLHCYVRVNDTTSWGGEYIKEEIIEISALLGT